MALDRQKNVNFRRFLASCLINLSPLSNQSEKVGFFKRFSSPSSFLFLFPLRFAFPRFQNLNSWSPIWL
ncbi:hypothetical protein MTR67_030521 [Solanum verrucosum]|uniref:Uncharacterized protein n=1 Tax=Solanum verrucosum TaxID=315347 RepID=A0AAF0RE17_SOLVR|nr:hypothetical protein MTR67_030521 [Solanum verrucosum]